jgi:hypothetical protein
VCFSFFSFLVAGRVVISRVFVLPHRDFPKSGEKTNERRTCWRLYREVIQRNHPFFAQKVNESPQSPPKKILRPLFFRCD